MKTQCVAAFVLGMLLYACGTPGVPAAPQASAPTMANTSPNPAMAGTSAANPAPTVAHAPATLDSRFVSANTRFGLKLYKRLTQQDAGQNLLVSPASVSMVLTVLYSGAAGATQQGMANTLEVQGLTLADLDRANADLLALLREPDSKVQLSIANALWTARGIEFRPEFLRRSTDIYQANVATLDFTAPGSVDTINAWVREQTHDKIERIVDQLDPATVLVLANALYFKGAWTDPFDPASTHDAPFHLADGSTRSVPMMERNGRYRYFRGDTFQAIALPYGDRRISMYVFLPDQTSSLAAWQERLSAQQWDAWMTQFHEDAKVLVMPKFTFKYAVKLNQPLIDLGMAVAFDPTRADFANLAPGPVVITEVRHKTFVEVNETGTEAAAVTAAAAAAGGATPPDMYVVVDRPFFVAIRDDITGILLFLGSINDPQHAGA